MIPQPPRRALRLKYHEALRWQTRVPTRNYDRDFESKLADLTETMQNRMPNSTTTPEQMLWYLLDCYPGILLYNCHYALGMAVQKGHLTPTFEPITKERKEFMGILDDFGHMMDEDEYTLVAELAGMDPRFPSDPAAPRNLDDILAEAGLA